MGRSIQIGTGGMHCIGAWLAQPDGAPRGGIVVVQEIFGVNAHIRGVVERYAQAGYVAIAPALFDRVETGVELGYDAEGIARGRALIAQLDIAHAVEDVAAAADSIRSAGRIGVVGYCWGGTVALLAGQRLGLPAVSYYGSRNVAWLDEALVGDASVFQFHFGERDASIPPEAIARHRSVLPQAEIHVYPAGHGFNCELRADYDAPSAALAWQRSLDFFARHLGGTA